jgi:anti-sigma regulatory factor (Ser/Thr protein kinase)
VMMPRIDGFELLRRLRADPGTRDIPVIMLTARAGQEASVEGLDAGADDYLAKPFRTEELIARVRVVLERIGGRRGTAPLPVVPASPRPDPVPVPVPVPVPAPKVPLPSVPVPTVAVPDVPPRPGPPTPRRAQEGPSTASGSWRLPSETAAIPVLRRRLRSWLDASGADPDHAYDLLLAACEAATNAVEHAQEPTEPFFDVTAELVNGSIRISVRDYGQWRERAASMDRGRGGTLMSAVGDITATPSPEGTTVVITAAPTGDRTITG